MKEKAGQKLSSTTAVGRGTGKKTKKVKFTTPPKARHSLSGIKRAALKPLQPHATSSKLLVGGGSPRLAAIGTNPKKTDLSVQTELKFPTLSTQTTTGNEKTTLVNKGTQTKIENSVDYQMCTTEVPPMEYWQMLAERRKDALAETLKENEELYAEIEQLKSRITELESQVHNRDYFAMMYKLAKEGESESQH